MKIKFENFGKILSRNEMKKINGGSGGPITCKAVACYYYDKNNSLIKSQCAPVASPNGAVCGCAGSGLLCYTNP